MIYALFFMVGVVMGIVVERLPRKPVDTLVLPQGVKRETIDSYIKNVWNEPKKEEGAVIMPDRAHITQRDDLKIDDLLQ